MEGQTHAVHGGAFFEAIGEGFETLERSSTVVSTDVLDAWYDPSPKALEKIARFLPFLVKTSPPLHGDGLRAALSAYRGVPIDQILLGSGTSSLMYLAFPHLVGPNDTVTLLDPMYGEYVHIFTKMIGCQTKRHLLNPRRSFRPDLSELARDCEGSRLVVMVNPNSPTGIAVDVDFVLGLLEELPAGCRLWIDETYIDFAPDGWSAERLVQHENRLIIAKSMSKFYGLSGLRTGYLVADPAFVAKLDSMSPPWSVGLIGQVAAVECLKDTLYYREKKAETEALRQELADQLASLAGVTVYPSVANFLLFRVGAPGAEALVERCRNRQIFLRNCDSLSHQFHDDHVRVAVKARETNGRIFEAVAAAMASY